MKNQIIYIQLKKKIKWKSILVYPIISRNPRLFNIHKTFAKNLNRARNFLIGGKKVYLNNFEDLLMLLIHN